jgi:excisionase family DNA binding protein
MFTEPVAMTTPKSLDDDPTMWRCVAEITAAIAPVVFARPDKRQPRKLPEPDEVLTPDEVAAHLDIPRKTVVALCADGRLVGAFKPGRRWRIPGRAVRLMAGELDSKRCR